MTQKLLDRGKLFIPEIHEALTVHCQKCLLLRCMSASFGGTLSRFLFLSLLTWAVLIMENGDLKSRVSPAVWAGLDVLLLGFGFHCSIPK